MDEHVNMRSYEYQSHKTVVEEALRFIINAEQHEDPIGAQCEPPYKISERELLAFRA